MSLINDALKRASHAIKQREATPISGIPLQPVATPPRRHPGPLLAVIAIIAMALAVGGWFFGKGGSAKPASDSAMKPAKPAAPKITATTTQASVAPPSRPVMETKTNVAINPQPSPPPPLSTPIQTNAPPQASPVAVAAVTATNTIHVQPTNAPLKEVVETKPAPVFPNLKLQGIYFRRVNPSAMINGRNVSNGDAIEGVKVIAIERQIVIVEFEGQTKALTME